MLGVNTVARTDRRHDAHPFHTPRSAADYVSEDVHQPATQALAERVRATTGLDNMEHRCKCIARPHAHERARESSQGFSLDDDVIVELQHKGLPRLLESDGSLRDLTFATGLDHPDIGRGQPGYARRVLLRNAHQDFCGNQRSAIELLDGPSEAFATQRWNDDGHPHRRANAPIPTCWT